MKLKDVIEKMVKPYEEDFDKYLGYTVVGSLLNVIQEAIDELNDKEVTDEWEKLISLVTNKRKEAYNKDIKEAKK